MKNSKGLLFLLMLIVYALPLTQSYAQNNVDLYGELRRTSSCNAGNVVIVKNAEIRVTGPNNNLIYTTQSDDGGYFYGYPEVSGPITLAPIFNSNPINGVTTFDIALVSRHILGIETFTNPFTQLAADVDNDGDIDATDMLIIRRLILHVIPEFQTYVLQGSGYVLVKVNSWRFVPQYFLNDPVFSNAFYTDPFNASYQGNCYSGCGNSYMDKLTLATIDIANFEWSEIPRTR